MGGGNKRFARYGWWVIIFSQSTPHLLENETDQPGGELVRSRVCLKIPSHLF